MTRRKIINMALSVVIAVILWSYVVYVVNPPTKVTVKNVPVQLMNQEVLTSSKLALSGNTNYTIDVVLSGTRSDLEEVNAQQITATADLFGLSAGQNYLTVNVTCPSFMTVEEVRPQRIQVFIEDRVTVNKPVTLVIGEVTDGYEVTMSNTGRAFIAVSGAESLVSRVVDLYAELDPGDFPLDETKRIPLSLIPRDSSGAEVEGVRLASSYIEVSGTVYATKMVALAIDLEGDPGLGAEINYANLPTKILIKGTQEALNAVRSITTNPIDISGMTEDKSIRLVPMLPEGIMLSDNAGSLNVTLSLTDSGKLSFDINVGSVLFADLAEGFGANLADGQQDLFIEAMVSGPLDAIKAAQQDMFIPYVDLSGIAEAGDYELPLIYDDRGSPYEVSYSPASIRVSVVSIEEEPAEEPGAETEQGEESSGENSGSTETSGSGN